MAIPFLYLDVETTGLNEKENSIIQLSGMFVMGNVVEEFNYRMRPYRGEEVPSDVTKVTGITNEMAQSYPDQQEAYISFKALLDKYVGERSTRAFLVGYNVSFDDKFIREWFTLNGAPFGWGYYVWFPYIDVMNLAALKTIPCRKTLPNFKLGTVYKHFTGKELTGAHDAMNDIVATKELFEILAKEILFPAK